MKYRKKPVVIEAFQMTIERRWDNSEWPNWLNKAWQKDKRTMGSLAISETHKDGEKILMIHTLEGDRHFVSWGDWIIQGVQGELYACKPDIFEQTYEAVE